MADEELEGLGRVLTRLALTEDDKLEQVNAGCRGPSCLGAPATAATAAAAC